MSSRPKRQDRIPDSMRYDMLPSLPCFTASSKQLGQMWRHDHNINEGGNSEEQKSCATTVVGPPSQSRPWDDLAGYPHIIIVQIL